MEQIKKKAILINSNEGTKKVDLVKEMKKYVKVQYVSFEDLLKNIVEPHVRLVDLTQQTKKYRELLEDIKEAFLRYNLHYFSLKMGEIMSDYFLGETRAQLLIIDIQNTEEFKKFKCSFVKSIPSVVFKDSLSDETVFTCPYDYIIDTSDTVEDIQYCCLALLREIGLEANKK